MAAVTYQTITLGKGKHNSPHEGACVMELASMLGGEPFSDHPQSACPAIGSFLRTYNDLIDCERRQDLYAYASKVVGSRGSARVERARFERLNEWISELRSRRWTRFVVREWLRGLAPKPPIEDAGIRAAHVATRSGAEAHREALALVDELLALGTPQPVVGDLTNAGACRDAIEAVGPVAD